MHDNERLIHSFYEAFDAGDHATMGAAYADTAKFSDPVFTSLDSAGVRAMWRMFCTGNNEIDVSHSEVQADDTDGTARWEAVYLFPRTGRRVHNRIEATFTFSGGRIVGHVDDFDLYAWTRMALGPLGTLLGWTPMLRKRVQGQAAAQLQKFQRSER